jgi:hypothetical protein
MHRKKTRSISWREASQDRSCCTVWSFWLDVRYAFGRLQVELQKSREAGAQLRNLPGPLNYIHGTLGAESPFRCVVLKRNALGQKVNRVRLNKGLNRTLGTKY